MAKKGTAKLPFPPPTWQWSEWQRGVWRDTAKLELPKSIWMNCGRGAGKDIIAIRCIIRDAMKLWQRKKRQAQAGKHVPMNPIVKIWVVAFQDANLDQTWADWNGELKHLAEQWGAVSGYEATETDWLFREIVREGKIVLFGRGEIEIEKRLVYTRGALRGQGVDFVHWTEHAHEQFPGMFLRGLKDELQGTITRAGRLGRMYSTTTPREPDEPYAVELKTRFGNDVLDVANGSARSANGLDVYYSFDSYSCEFLEPWQVTQIRAEEADGWRYERERLARFVVGDLGGELVFDRAWIEKCLYQKRAEPARPKAAVDELEEWQRARMPRRHVVAFRPRTCGVDIARFGEDETAYFVIEEWDEPPVPTAKASGPCAVIVHAELHRKLPGQEVVADLKRLHDEWGCDYVVDETGHRGYIADFAPSWLNFTATQFGRHKEKWVTGLKMLLQMGRLFIPDPETSEGLDDAVRDALRKLIKQLCQYTKTVRGSGAIEYSHPSGGHDDAVDGCMLGCMRIIERIQEKPAKSDAADMFAGQMF
jgi:hypothetical protein